MIRTKWSILGPEKVAIERRTRTLELGAAVRAFNDLAVPGMGNVYFGKQLALAVLGVAVAQRIRDAGGKVQNIETANAIEALGCWLAFETNGWNGDRRLRGVSKMRERGVPSFAEARKRSFYVTQPMRMATLQPLMELGLVAARSERFNAFSISEEGQHLIDALSGPDHETVFGRLCKWVSGKGRSPESLTGPLSPLEPLPRFARDLLRGCVIRGDGMRPKRRRAVLAWMERCATKDPGRDDARPAELDDEHWRDVEAGARFFAVRDAAVELLDAVEEQMENQDVPKLFLDKPLPENLGLYSSALIARAQAFVDMGHDPSPRLEASGFCRECLDEAHVVEHLVRRDDRVLRLSDGAVIPGPAFRGRPGGLESDTADEEESSVGEAGRSPRIDNMRLFSVDLQGKLSEYLEARE